MSHEVIHHMKGTDQYDTLLNMAVDYVKSNYNYDAVINGIHEDYAKQGIQLDETGIQDELLAKFVEEKLFKDKTSINRLIRENPNGFNKIYYFVKDNIQDTIKNATSKEEQRYLMNMENLYTKAMSKATTSPLEENGATNYSRNSKAFNDIVNRQDVVRMNDGTYAFKVNIDLNNKNSLSKKDVQNIINSLDSQIITLDGDVINIRKKSGREYSYGTSNQKMWKSEANQKKQIAPFVKEAIETSTFDRFEENRKFTSVSKLMAPDGFDKRTAVVIDSNGSAYEMAVVIGINNNANSAYYGKNLYDISKIKNIGTSTSPEGFVLIDANVTNNVPQVNAQVNTANPNVATITANQKKPGTDSSLGRTLSEYSQPNETVKVPGTEVEVKKPYKVARIEEITTNGFLRKLGEDFGISTPYMKNYKPILQEIVNDSIKNGKINYNFVNQMFEDLWNQGIYLEDSITKQSGNENLSKMISDYTLNEGQAKHALGEAGFEDFKKQHPRKLHFLANSTGIDVAYKELSKKYPRLFNPNLHKMDEQLYEIVKVKEMLDVQEKPLSGKSKQIHDYYNYEFQKDIESVPSFV